MARYVVVAQVPAGPTIEAQITFTVTDAKGGQAQLLSSGSVVLDIQIASLMTAEEYAARYLWPAFMAAAQIANVSIPGFRPPPTDIIRAS